MKFNFSNLKKIPLIFSVDKVENDRRIGVQLVIHLFIIDIKIGVNKEIYQD